MAASQRQATQLPHVEKVRRRGTPRKPPRRDEGLRRRRFAFFVVVPMLLMLGSIYLHTVSAGLESRAVELREQSAMLEARMERLDVQVSEASAPGRVRPLARENLGMRSPAAENMKVYEVEDGTQNAKQQVQEDSR